MNYAYVLLRIISNNFLFCTFLNFEQVSIENLLIYKRSYIHVFTKQQLEIYSSLMNSLQNINNSSTSFKNWKYELSFTHWSYFFCDRHEVLQNHFIYFYRTHKNNLDKENSQLLISNKLANK